MKRITKSAAVLVALVISVSFVIIGKLAFVGWNEGASLADGLIRIRASNAEDARRLAQIDEKITTPSTMEVHVTNGVFYEMSQANDFRVRLCLNGSGIVARARVGVDPLRVIYDAPNEDEIIAERIRAIAKKHGIKESIEIEEVSTPIDTLTGR